MQQMFLRQIAFTMVGLVGCSPAYKPPWMQQREALQSLAPTRKFESEPPDAARGGPAPKRRTTPFKLRIYADSHCFRHGSCRGRLRRLVRRASGFTRTAFGVGFDLVEIKKWDLRGPDSTLSTALAQLGREDPGTDVDWVVGIITRVRLLAGPRHAIGRAHILGRHFVVDTTADVAEVAALNRHYNLTSRRARMQVHGERRVHRDVSTFLHEWGHNLGALHVGDPRFFMSPQHTVRSTDFAPENVKLIEISLDHRDRLRLKEGPDREQILVAWRKQIRQVLASEKDTAWDPRSRKELLRELDAGFGKPGRVVLALPLAERGRGSTRLCGGDDAKKSPAAPRVATAATRTRVGPGDGCDGSDLRRCYERGVAYATGSGVRQNLRGAVTRFRRACDGNLAEGCYNLAVAYSNGLGVPRNERKAAGLFRRACDRKLAAGCHYLGLHLDLGLGVPANQRRAAPLYRRACDGGEEAACDRLDRLCRRPELQAKGSRPPACEGRGN